MNTSLLSLVVAAVLLLVVVVRRALYAVGVHRTFRGLRVVPCPLGETSTIQVDALHAAVTAFAGEPQLRVRYCTKWPEQRLCAQECLHRVDPLVVPQRFRACQRRRAQNNPPTLEWQGMARTAVELESHRPAIEA